MFFTRPADSRTALISILEGMRTPGGKRLNGKLEGIEANTQNPSFSPENFIAEMHSWSSVTMAVSVRAKERDCRTLSICQHWINQQNIAHRPCRNGSDVSFTRNAKITKHLPFLHRNACCFFLQAPTALQVFKLKCHEYECLRPVGLLFPRLHSSALLRKAVARKTTTFELLKCTGVLHRSPLPVSKLIAQKLVYANWGVCWYDLCEM